ncbi:hypothetical protein I250019C1_06170 [Faecalibacterium sp. i25-0019-C1]
MEVTINYNGQAVTVEVTLEVYEFLDRADHKTENLFHEQRRHWDGREFDEYIITTEGVGIYGETPEEYLCRMETLHELMAVLDTCTEAQRRRFLLYALDGLSLAEIGVLCGCSKVAVYQSVEAVRKKFIHFAKRTFLWRCPMRSSKRFFWTREPRPPEIARCSGIRRFIPSIVTTESKMPPSAGRSHRRRII